MEIQRDYIYNIYIDVKTYKEDEQRPTFAHPLSEVLEQRASLRTKKLWCYKVLLDCSGPYVENQVAQCSPVLALLH